MNDEQDILMLNSRVYRRMHALIDLSDLTAMDAAFLDELETNLDADMKEIAQALAHVAALVRQASNTLTPVHQALIARVHRQTSH